MTTEKEAVDNDDFIEMDESDFEDKPASEELDSNQELKVNSDAKQTSNATENTQDTQNTEDKNILDFINSRAKYNGENTKFNSIDEAITAIQKGLNYDKVKAKVDEESSNNVIIDYVGKMASKMGLTPQEYIEKVKAYEAEQEKQKIEADVQDMVNNGVSEEVARRVARVEARMKQLDDEKAEFEKLKAEEKAQKDKDKEYEEFLNAYPDVKAEEIPNEVFENAKTIGLKSAYAQYENKKLKAELEQMRQNQKNASNSVVTPTSDGSGTEQSSKDAFLIGFDSV